MRSQNVISTKEGIPVDDAERERCAQIRETLTNPVGFAIAAGYEMGSEAGIRDAASAATSLGMRAGLEIAAEQLEQLAARLRSHAQPPPQDDQPEQE